MIACGGFAAAAVWPAFGQVTHSSVTVSGNYSHSAFLEPPQTSRVIQAPPIVVNPGGGRGGVNCYLPNWSNPFQYHMHGYGCRYFEGGYRIITQPVWVPAYWTREFIPAQYEAHEIDGQWISVLVRDPGWREIYVEGHYEPRQTQVWVDGYWNCGY